MHRFSRIALVWLVALMALAARTSEAHIHFCLDGQEPFSSFHAADTGPNCDNDNSGARNDLDVDIGGGSLAKPNVDIQFFGAPPFAFDLLVFVQPPAASAERPAVAEFPPAKHPYLFRPPLRGPPA